MEPNVIDFVLLILIVRFAIRNMYQAYHLKTFDCITFGKPNVTAVLFKTGNP